METRGGDASKRSAAALVVRRSDGVGAAVLEPVVDPEVDPVDVLPPTVPAEVPLLVVPDAEFPPPLPPPQAVVRKAIQPMTIQVRSTCKGIFIVLLGVAREFESDNL